MFNKESFNKIIGSTKHALSKRTPEILTGIGIAGMITTTVLAVKATPKAMRLIEEEKERRRSVMHGADWDGDRELIIDEPLSPVEVVKVAWKPYLPAVGICAASVTCLIGASSVNAKRNAALATVYKLTETAFTDYKEQVIETIGEEKEKFIREKVDEKRIERNPVSQNTVIVTDSGSQLCYDAISGRYFNSNVETIKRSFNVINRHALNNEYVSLNDLYDELGLDRIPLGDELGWRIDHGYIEESFSSHIADDGRPCIVLGYNVSPVRDYYKFL